MKRPIAVILAAICMVSSPLAAQEAAAPKLSLEQKMLLRCSTALALTAQAQGEGDETALTHPPLAEKGGEFFVHSMAQVMDKAKLSREQVITQIARERDELQNGETLEQVMPICLQLLKNSGL